MQNAKRNKLLISIALVSVSILMFAIAIGRYQILIKSQAADHNVSISFSGESSPVDQKFGVTIPDITNDAVVQNTITTFQNTGIYIRILDPTAETIANPNFTALEQASFHWYFSFGDYDKMNAGVAAYYATHDQEIVAGLTNNDAIDKGKTQAFLAAHPKAKFHAAELPVWERTVPRSLIHDRGHDPSVMEALSVKTWLDNPRNDNIFADAYLMYASFYDASNDIDGNSGVFMNWPPGSKMALVDVATYDSSTPEQARRFAVLTGAIFSALTANNAQISYTIAGDISTMAAQEKIIIRKFADFVAAHPKVMWPNPSSGAGDPWYDPGADQSSSPHGKTDPIFGMIGKNGNDYYGFLINTRNMSVDVSVPSSMDLTGSSIFSNLRGTGNWIENGRVTLQPFETVAFSPNGTPDVATPTAGGSSPTTGPTPVLPAELNGKLACDPGPDPYRSNSIWVYNNTDRVINNINGDVFRCPYVPGMIEQYRGSFKCEPTCRADEPNCLVGVWDGNLSNAMRNIVLQPGETRIFSVETNDCSITQLDIRNDDNESVTECHNVQSSNTVNVGEMWPGGIAFAIMENPTGYNTTTQSCNPVTNTPTEQPSNTPTENPSETPTNTPTDLPTETPTETPTSTPTDSPTPTDTPEPTATNTPVPTDTPTNTPTPTPTPTFTPTATSTPTSIPTATPIPTLIAQQPPTPTPINQITVDGQKPGVTPWLLIFAPIAIVLLGLVL